MKFAGIKEIGLSNNDQHLANNYAQSLLLASPDILVSMGEHIKNVGFEKGFKQLKRFAEDARAGNILEHLDERSVMHSIKYGIDKALGEHPSGSNLIEFPEFKIKEVASAESLIMESDEKPIPVECLRHEPYVLLHNKKTYYVGGCSNSKGLQESPYPYSIEYQLINDKGYVVNDSSELASYINLYRLHLSAKERGLNEIAKKAQSTKLPFGHKLFFGKKALLKFSRYKSIQRLEKMIFGQTLKDTFYAKRCTAKLQKKLGLPVNCKHPL